MASEKESAERLERRLDESLHRYNRSQKITLVLGIILIVFIVTYLGILGAKVRDLAQPDSVSEIAVGYAEEQLPVVRKRMTEELNTNAEQYVNEGFDVLIESIPSIRENIEGYSGSEFKSLLIKVKEGVYDLADQTIDTHADQVRQMLAHLENTDSTEEFEHELYDMLTEPLNQSQAHVDLRAYAITLSELAEKVEKLNENENLSESEQVERHILIALKELSDRSDKRVDIKLPDNP